MLGFQMKPGEPAILEWIREQGLDPNTVSRNVIVDEEDGSFILERYVYTADGKVQRDPDDGQRAWKVPVRVTPTRPFPGMEPKVELRGEHGPEVSW
jgi:hypothetical protein